jgi:two-component system, sensor histidine kinase
MSGSYSETLVVTPNPVDADLARSFLQAGGIHAQACASLSELRVRLAHGAGCVVIVEEALVDDEMPALHEALDAQPPWSDIPLVLVASEDTELRGMVERAFPNSGNITLLSRPLHPMTLLSAVEVGLRARHRQVQVRDLINQREEALRQRDEFVAMLAHELRNPLAPMRNAVYLQKRLDIGDPMFGKTRDIFDRQVNHLSRLVDDLLDVARLERGKVQLQLRRVDLNDSVTAAVEACMPVIQAAGHRVHVHLAREALPLQADPVRIEQILSNLINNACKFTPDGGEITVTTCRKGPSAEVSVSDTGIGIAPDRIEAMFNPFTQGEHSLARSTGGLGIGLTIARRVARLHGATLTASSRGPGEGTTFLARFPLELVAQPLPDLPVAQVTVPHPKRVLVVDDNPDIRDTLRMLIGMWGHQVSVAATGEKGLELALNDHPDVALVDIGLPGINGYDVAKEIRRASTRWDSLIKLVAITGYGQPADRERALASGFDNHMLKPVDPILLEKVFSD